MDRSQVRIEELHIRSFRGIDELHLTFPDEQGEPGSLSVLAGDNGCGKTAVLEAILLVLGRDDLLPEDAASLEEQVRFGASDFFINATARKGDATRITLAVDVKTLRRRGQGIRFPGEDTSDISWWQTIDELKPSVEYFSARREPEALGETPDRRGARSVREARRVVELKRRLVNTYYHSLRAGRGGEMLETSPFARLQRFMQRFLGEDTILDVLPATNDPGTGDEVIVRKGEVPEDITSLAMARQAAAKDKRIPVIVPIDRLSSGQVALFAFAGPLIFRDTPANVVLIDEPEQHMHVQWQRHLLTALRDLSPGSQIIVATHSLDVLDSALSSERFLLAREDDPRSRLAVNNAAAE